MAYRLAIFDLDGTILDTLDDLTDSVNYALNKSGFPLRTKDEIRSFVGNGIKLLIERAVPFGTDTESIDNVFGIFKNYYKFHCADKTKPYNGIMECLKSLRQQNVKIAVVSNKADFAVQELCEQYFEGLFDFSVGEREGIEKKPSPDSVNEVLNILNETRNNAVYIGDSEVDIQTARNAGMDCISVTWGFRGREFLTAEGAETFADTTDEVLRLIVN